MSRTEPYFVPDDGGVRVSLADYEQELLTNLVTDLRHLLMAEEHEFLRRLKPPAHPGDDEAEEAYRGLVDDELLRGRLDGLDVLEETMDGGILDDDQVAAWMQALTNLRLILGERLEAGGADLAAHELPDDPAATIFEWAGELLEWLVRAASAA
ncbi:MAG: hypothetical protein DHS20C19_01130 [Acidimicrobiales bacterium]|nr:MAG: hypothetical protein DHS20C19_01130 [Acidimicrobiales bacterium]